MELYLFFDDYIVIEAVHALTRERRKASTRNVRDRFNQILREKPALAYVARHAKSHSTISKSFVRLIRAGLIASDERGARINADAFLPWYEDMRERYGHNMLNWPYKVPRGPNGPDWDGATFIHLKESE